MASVLTFPSHHSNYSQSESWKRQTKVEFRSCNGDVGCDTTVIFASDRPQTFCFDATSKWKVRTEMTNEVSPPSWSTDDFESLISLVRKHPCLYNVYDPSRKNFLETQNVWEQISQELGKPGKMIIIYRYSKHLSTKNAGRKGA